MLHHKGKFTIVFIALVTSASFFSIFLANYSFSLNCRCVEYTVWDDSCDGVNCDYSLKYERLACCDGVNYATCSATAGYTTIQQWELSGTCTGTDYGAPCSADNNCQGDIFSWSNNIWENCELDELIETHSWQVYRCQ